MKRVTSKTRLKNTSKKYFYNGTFYRSSWEVKTAQYFDLHQIYYEYEAYYFQLARYSRFFPDFYLPVYNMFIEVKGYARPLFLRKLKKFREMYSNVNYEIWDKTVLKTRGIL